MSYEDIRGFIEKINELEIAYKNKEKIDEKLSDVINIYNKISLEEESPSLINLLKGKIINIVTSNEGPEKAKSLEASLQ